MRKILLISAMFILLLQFSSCNINDGTSGLPSNPDNAFAQNFGAVVSKDFIGQVVDTNNNHLQGVTITIGTKTALTDANGVFIINAASVREQFAYVTATKVGYFDGSRSLVPAPQGKNNVRIMMVANTPTSTVQAESPSSVSLPDGSKVSFDGAFQDENGAIYSGTVTVAMYHLKATDDNIDKLMPGMLYGQTELNKEALLQTYGMLNVELRGSNGEKLNLASGHTAEITMPIETSQLGSAPDVIPLWHFDEAKGYWKEDGVAAKVGNNYRGEVSHFSWWNCDAFSQMVTLTVKLVDANGNPLSNLAVGLVASGTSYPVMGYVNENGQVSGLIPANQTLTLNVYADYYSCTTSNIVYTTSIGPFTADTILPNITITTSSSVASSNVVGTLLKCDSTNVINGYVILTRSGGTSISAVSNGAFSFNELYCLNNTQFTLQGYDVDSLQQTADIAYNFTSPTTNIGNLQACTAVDEFISYKIDNNPTVFLLSNISAGASQQGGPSNQLYIYGNDTTGGLYIWGNTNVLGIYTTAEFSIEGGNVGYISSTTTNTIQFNLSQFGAVGEYIDMTFSGTYLDSNNLSHTLTGVAHVIRDN